MEHIVKQLEKGNKELQNKLETSFEQKFEELEGEPKMKNINIQVKTINTGCGIMSVSHTPNQALLRALVMFNSGLRPSFNITQCSKVDLVWGMGH